MENIVRCQSELKYDMRVHENDVRGIYLVHNRISLPSCNTELGILFYYSSSYIDSARPLRSDYILLNSIVRLSYM